MKNLNILLSQGYKPGPLTSVFSRLLYLSLFVQIVFAPYAACLAWTQGAHVTEQQLAHHTLLKADVGHHHSSPSDNQMVRLNILDSNVTLIPSSILGGAASYALSTGALLGDPDPQEHNFVFPQHSKEYPTPQGWYPTAPSRPPLV